eukprot:Skav212330  [mRNA]  locus=scaffold3374:221083:222814:- [translate_table: standard]
MLNLSGWLPILKLGAQCVNLQALVWDAHSEVTLESMMDSDCRGGSQLLLLQKLAFCMDMSPVCVVSHSFAVERWMLLGLDKDSNDPRTAAVSGPTLRDWIAEAATWHMHRYNLGLSVDELQQLGVLGELRLSGCLRPSFPTTTGSERRVPRTSRDTAGVLHSNGKCEQQ